MRVSPTARLGQPDSDGNDGRYHQPRGLLTERGFTFMVSISPLDVPSFCWMEFVMA